MASNTTQTGDANVGRLPGLKDSYRRWYFEATAWLLLGLTLVAFGDNLVTDIGQPSNSDPKFIVHGLFCGAWMVLLIVQSRYVRIRKIASHRKLGDAFGKFIVIGAIVSTIWLFIVAFKGFAAMSPEVKTNRLMLAGFGFCIWLAYRQRYRADHHKRLIFVGTFFLLDPILARVFDPMLVPFEGMITEPVVEALFLPWLYSLWSAFFGSLLAYDWMVAQRPHPVTLAGIGWFALVAAVAWLT